MSVFRKFFGSCCCPNNQNDRDNMFNIDKHKTLKVEEPENENVEFMFKFKNSNSLRKNDSQQEFRQSIVSFMSYPNMQEYEKEKESQMQMLNPLDKINQVKSKFDKLHFKQTTSSNKISNDDSYFMLRNNSRYFTQEEIEGYDKLVLEEIEGELIKNFSQKLYINAGGLEGTQRKAYDGITFFGLTFKDEEGKVINDVEINDKNYKSFLQEERTNREIDLDNVDPHLFYIYFKKETKSYFLRSYTGKQNNFAHLLIKLERPLIIKRKEFFCVGEMIFHLQIDQEVNSLEIDKLPNRNSTDFKKYIFKKEESPITIGRDRTCNIIFLNDKSFSRVHITFVFDFDSNNWMMYDGNLQKRSTNGTWLYGLHSYELVSKTVFRILNSKFVINIVK